MIALVLAWVGTACWVVCFWWMHRISKRQDALLREMSEQNDRIEQLSREERDLIDEVHPKVGEIRDHVSEVKAALKGPGG